MANGKFFQGVALTGEKQYHSKWGKWKQEVFFLRWKEL